jgi:hypothetical protein
MAWAVPIAWAICCSASAHPQDLPVIEQTVAAAVLPEMETDRDAFTPATSTVTIGWSLLESSYSFIDNRFDYDTHSLPETLFRYGLTERIELRLGWNYEAGGPGNVVTAEESSEGLPGEGVVWESHALYGMKVQVTEQRGWIPRSCAILEGFTPTSGPAPASQPVVTYAAGWELPNRWRIDGALRYAMGAERNNSFNRWGPSMLLRIPVTEEFHAHFEYFGVFSQGWFDDTTRAFVSPGCHYNFTDNLELGLRVGWGITPDAANFFANTGFGWRF